jgi:hypothetical protein
MLQVNIFGWSIIERISNVYNNVFQANIEKGGPLSILARCVSTGERVRVHVRGINRIRGFAVGTLVIKMSN